MTVTIENLYTGNGSTTDYSFTFPYLDTTDIKVTLATVATTAYSLLNATTVRFDSAPGNGVAIRIYRETAFDTPKATFYPGSAIRANDLNDNTLQNLYVNQESNDKVADAWLSGDPTVISTEAWYTTDDTKVATTKAIEGRIDAKIDTALTGDIAAGNKITITDNSPSSGQITVALTSGSLVNSDVNASAAIAGTKITPSFGSQNVSTSGTLASGAATVTGNIAVSGTVDGRDIAADGTKLDGIETNATADQTNAEIRTAVEAATDSNVFTDADHTKLNAIEDNATRDQTAAEIRTLVESASDSNVFTDADHTKLNGIEASATADQTAAEIRTLVESASDSNVFTDADHTKLNAIEANATADQTAGEIKTLLQSDKLTASEIANGTITSTQIATGALDGRYYTETELTSGALDGRYYTETESDARYFNISTGDTIKDGDTFPDNDTTIATTAAINDRIIDLVDDVGGFVPIANETSFPAANPDVNNGAGTLVSIKALASNLTSNGSGVATIANGAGSGNTVTINGLANSTTYAATFGMIVETTSTLHTYTFHRQVPKATEVSTVAGSISNVNAVGGNISNVNTVAGNNSNITTVAGANSNITSVAGSISNVNTVATNISSVNDFAARYRVASSAPSSSLDTGDLYFDTSANELKVYNGSAWQGGVTATGNLAGLGANTFTGNQSLGDNLKVILGTGNDLTVWHNGTNSYIQSTTGDLFIESGSDIFLYNGATNEYYAKFIPNGAVELYYDNSKKFETTSSGATVTGSIYTNTGGGAAQLGTHLDLGDNQKARFGASDDLQIYHNGTHSEISDSGTGDLRILTSKLKVLNNPASANELMIQATENGGVELYYNGVEKLSTVSGGVEITGDLIPNSTGAHALGTTSVQFNGLYLSDNGVANFGAGLDLQIYHDGTDNHIVSSNGQIDIKVASNEDAIIAKPNAAVELYHNNLLRFQTTSDGFQAQSNTSEAVFTIRSTAQDGAPTLQFLSDDYDDNADAWRIRADGGGTAFGISNKASGSWEKNIECNENGNVELYYDNSTKLETVPTGIYVYGDVGVGVGGTGNLFSGDNNKLMCGAGNDLQIYHTGNAHKIVGANTGNLHIQAPETHIMNVAGTQFQAKFIDHGAAELYHNDSKKLETTSGGVNVIGALTVDGSALASGNTFTAVADGAIATNKPVCVVSTGKVQQIKAVTTAVDPVQHNNSFQNVQSGYRVGSHHASYDPDNNRIGLVYQKSTPHNGQIVGSVGYDDNDDGSMSFGGSSSDIASNPNEDQYDVCYAGNSQFLAVFRDSDNTDKGACRVLYYSNASQNSFALASNTYTFETAQIDMIRACEAGTNKVLIVWRPMSGTYDNKIRGCVASISGTGASASVSFGTVITVENSTTSYFGYGDELAQAGSTSKFFFAYGYYHNSNWQGGAKFLTISGTSLTAHSRTQYWAHTEGDYHGHPKPAYHSVENKIVLFFRAQNYGHIRVGTVSGNSITAWSSSVGTQGGTPGQGVSLSDGACWYDSSINKLMFVYNQLGVSTATLSGTTLTWGTARNLGDYISGFQANNVHALKTMDGKGYSFTVTNFSQNHLKGVLLNFAQPISNLSTAGNYPVGWVDSAYSDGDTVTIKTIGNTQGSFSSLTPGTKYYLQGNGTIATSADSDLDSVWGSAKPIAGTAIKSDTILISSPHSQ